MEIGEWIQDASQLHSMPLNMLEKNHEVKNFEALKHVLNHYIKTPRTLEVSFLVFVHFKGGHFDAFNVDINMKCNTTMPM